MKVTVETGPDSEMTAVADLANATIYGDSQFRIPIQTRINGQSRFTAALCGFQVEAKEIDAIPGLVKHVLGGLINVGRLPNYAFVARRARRVYPVYTINDEVMATTPGGPAFQHVELAKVREYLTDYLHETNILGESGRSDKLHVRGINRHFLALRRPVMYLKKRVTGEPEFWAPVFETGDENGLYTYAASARRDAKGKEGTEVLLLRQIVAELLSTQGRLSNKYDLRADRIQTTYWENLRDQLAPLEETIVAGNRTLPLYSDGTDVIAVETRGDENRYGLYIGKTTSDVTERANADFQRRRISN